METHMEKILKRMYSMKVSELMDPRAWDMPVLEKDEPISHAFFMLRSNNHAWVVESEKTMKLVGVIERVDLLRAMLPPESIPYTYGSIQMHIKNIYMKKGVKVSDIMTKKVIVAEEDANLKDMMIKMRKYKIEKLPVIDRNRILVGELTLKSIIIYFTRLLRESG